MSNTSFEHPLDPIIISAARDEWDNVTGIMSRVFDHADFDKSAYASQDIAERIYILVDNGQLDVEGNMRRWREGRVKKMPPLKAQETD
jgi:hypothetical protein